MTLLLSLDSRTNGVVSFTNNYQMFIFIFLSHIVVLYSLL